MGKFAALLLLATSITSLLLAVTSVAISWSVASRCTRAVKSLRAALRTPPSNARLIQLETDQAALSSGLSSVTTTVKRLSSRNGMQDVRARQAQEPPPIGATKAELRRHYGIAGMNGPDQARHQLSLVPNNQEGS